MGISHLKNQFMAVNIINPNKPKRYILDALLIREKGPHESIINALVWSFGRVIEDLSMAISLVGLRMQLPYATTEDLDLYWAPILGLHRRSIESDSDYRQRLMTRLAILKSSGTKPEGEAILNNILGMPNAVRLDTYWPAEVRVGWNSYTAMRRAEERYAAISETLGDMLAAGITWSTSFPYKTYNMDVMMDGQAKTYYSLDTGLALPKWAMYLMRVDIFNQGAADDYLDACLETSHTLLSMMDAKLWTQRARSYSADAKLMVSHAKNDTLDVHLRQIRSKSDSMDVVAEAQITNFYDLAAWAEANRRGFYQMAVELVMSS
ncbi:MAG: hypothetical protein ACYDG4_15120 [Desulfuromonadaceae bacterium]